MKRLILALIVLLSLALPGCSDKRAEELFETAKLEELQNNLPHARELYREIIKNYPESPFAEQAERRLSELK